MRPLLSPAGLRPTKAEMDVAQAGAYLVWLSALLTKREVMLTIWIIRS
jgi:hypothetical protein